MARKRVVQIYSFGGSSTYSIRGDLYMNNIILKNSIRYFFIILGISAFGLFVYPGLYKYDKLDQKYPVMINRVTGETKVLYGDVWETVGNVDAQLSKFEEYKQQIFEKLQQQNDEIKNGVLDSLTSELENTKNDIIAETKSAVLETQKYSVSSETVPTYEDGTSVFNSVRNRDDSKDDVYSGESFDKGDTQVTVKKIMGTPDTINTAGPYETWFYELSMVKFKDGLVEGWSNTSKNLHLK